MSKMMMNRRELLKVTAMVGGGAMFNLAIAQDGTADPDTIEDGVKSLNVFVQIEANGKIRIAASLPEMGQGVKTALPMIIAEELGARWEDVIVEQAPVDDAFGVQAAGGSWSIARNQDTMRRMGASAREMLISAAALHMEVEREDLRAVDSRVVHTSGRSRSFAELASLAVNQPVPDPETLQYKDPNNYTILGKKIPGVDNLAIVTGNADFGIDVTIPNMRYATYTKCPEIGGTAVSFNEAEIKNLPGVVDAFIVEPNNAAGNSNIPFFKEMAVLRGGVAIVAEDTWSAIAAKRRLRVKWDQAQASKDDWQDMIEWANGVAQAGGGELVKDNADIDAVLNDPNNKTVEGFYQFPYLAHVCMEPMNCVADYQPASGDVPAKLNLWMGSQFPGQAKEVAYNLLGVAPDDVEIKLMRLGGGFGRRGVHDFAAEAMMIAKQAGVPVKLTWTRPDDIHSDFYRVGGFQNMKGAVNGNGQLAAWDQHYIGFKTPTRDISGAGFFGNEFPLVAMDNARVSKSMKAIKTPCGAWRAPGSNSNAFVEQSFIHELAVLAGRDHLEFLLELLGDDRWIVEGNADIVNTGRARGVINLAAAEANWGKKLPAGTAQGLAFYFCHAAHVAEIAEVSVDSKRNFQVNKVTVAVDVGPIVNRSGALSQVEGSIVDGLSAMAGQKITMANGRIEQDNFHQYPVMRISATPEIDVHFIESDFPSTGLGEPALPPLAPAVTNAIFAATGERIRSMPLSDLGYNLT